MKRIVLLRHAKSSWSDPEMEDIERPLNQRGRLTAPMMGAWIAEQRLDPDYVILSPARRSKETWDRMARVMEKAPKPQVEKSLYMADPETMLKILQAAPKDADTVLLVGHQPGLSSFARKLANGTVPGGPKRAFTKFPTGAAAVIEIDAEDWTETEFGEGEFRAFACPKELV
ncbi:MAG: histidine phosphatase family protein [Pseudomonadota bacterium]